jgi:hypothetical protein
MAETLRDRALAMEDAAAEDLTSLEGLGRRFAWREYCRDEGLLNQSGRVAGRVPLEVLSRRDEADSDDVPCECHDGTCPVGEL